MDVDYIHKVCTQADRKEKKIFILGLPFQLITRKKKITSSIIKTKTINKQQTSNLASNNDNM